MDVLGMIKDLEIESLLFLGFLNLPGLFLLFLSLLPLQFFLFLLSLHFFFFFLFPFQFFPLLFLL